MPTAPRRRWFQLLNTDIRDIFKSEGRLVDEALLQELLDILIRTDIAVPLAQAIVTEVDFKFRARMVELDELLTTVKMTAKALMARGSRTP